MQIAKQVEEIMLDLLFKPEELVGGQPPADAVFVDGLMRKFAFNRQRAEASKKKIAALCNEMNPAFQSSSGGGWSFLNLCMDRNGDQWGEHRDCEALVALAEATGQGGYLMREMANIMPGGMPYVHFSTT